MTRVLVVQNGADDGPSRVGEWLEESGCVLDVRRAYAGDEVPLTVADACADALVVLGGAMNAYDDHVAPWLASARALLADAVAHGVPTLGICLGAQLLAVAAGGEVAQGRVPEVGACTVAVLPAARDDELMHGLDGDLAAPQWHWQGVTELPPDAVTLAASPDYPHQVFRVGATAWGLQLHPELTGAMAAEWAAADADQLLVDGIDGAGAVAGVTRAEPAVERSWRPVVERFAALARVARVTSAT